MGTSIPLAPAAPLRPRRPRTITPAQDRHLYQFGVYPHLNAW